MELVCLLSSGEDTWAQVAGLMREGNWDKIVLIGDERIRNFQHEKDFDFIKADFSKKLLDLQEFFIKKLKGRFNGMEVACSIASGDGKEHMALISALINVPVGIRFAALTKEGITYL